MKFLLVSDIHLTDHPRDEYRFGLFPWILEQQKKYKPDALICLGDLTERKNKHSSILVNKTVNGFSLLKPPVYVLRANHDGSTPDWPYFEFMDKIEGIKFCSDFTLAQNIQWTFIPHQLNQEDFDKFLDQVPKGWMLGIHQTVTGAIGESGQQLTGFEIPPNNARAIYSGDIHPPHKVGSVTYVGAPFPVHFGDDYKARVLLLDINDKEIKETNLYFPSPKKLHLQIRALDEIPQLDKGDQVKVTLELTPEEFVEWSEHKRNIIEYCNQQGIEVHGFVLKKLERRKRQRLEEPKGKTRTEFFTEFCNAEKLSSSIRKAGSSYLEV